MVRVRPRRSGVLIEVPIVLCIVFGIVALGLHYHNRIEAFILFMKASFWAWVSLALAVAIVLVVAWCIARVLDELKRVRSESVMKPVPVPVRREGED